MGTDLHITLFVQDFSIFNASSITTSRGSALQPDSAAVDVLMKLLVDRQHVLV